MLLLILNNVQYFKNVVFSFEKGSNGQNHSFSGFQQQINKIYPIKSSHFLHPLTLFGKLCYGTDSRNSLNVPPATEMMYFARRQKIMRFKL